MTAPQRPFSLLAKPTGAACNLDCSYCFFLSKEALWDAKNQTMSIEVLRDFIRSYLASQPDGPVTVGWQGGEPTMRGLPFFEKAVEFCQQYARPRQQVQHSIQTNATLLTDEWGEFFAANNFLVGVSLDGPAHLHDSYRVNKAGRGTYQQVVRGWEILQRHGVETNILCTVNAVNQHHPLEVYRHFRDDLGAKFMQFIPIVERVSPGDEEVAEASWRDEDGNWVPYAQHGNQTTSRTVDPSAWGDFLVAIFDEWVGRDIGEVFVQHFDVTLGARLGQYSLCVHAPQCGDALAMEHNGDVYSCDHFVEPDYLLGNLASQTFQSMLAAPKQRKFGSDKLTQLPSQCLNCKVRWACNGGCPKDRFALTQDGESGLNYLCPGYYKFFSHVWPTIDRMAWLLQRGRPATDIWTMK